MGTARSWKTKAANKAGLTLAEVRQLVEQTADVDGRCVLGAKVKLNGALLELSLVEVPPS